jgi:hypothetical protein
MLDEYGSLTIKLATIAGAVFLLYTIIKNLYNYYEDMTVLLEEPITANNNPKDFAGDSLPVIINDVGLTYSVSLWIYINSWEYKAKTVKEIWSRGPMRLYFDGLNNNLILDVGTYGENGSQRIEYINFPVQKWMNIIVVVENRTIDLWLNGKLYKSRVFDNLIYNNNKNNLSLLKDGGFDGLVSRLYYYKKALRRNEILTIFNNDPYPSNFITRLWNRMLYFFFANKSN